MRVDSNTSRYALPGRFSSPPPGVRPPVELAAALRGCADELTDDARATGMTATRAVGLMREAAGMLVVMVAVVEAHP